MQLEKLLIISLDLEYHSQILKIKKNQHRRNLNEMKGPSSLPVSLPRHLLLFIHLMLYA